MIKFFDNTLIKGNHFLTEVNATDVWYPILIYLFGKFSQAKHILEVGTADGYGSYYLAQVAKENGGMFYGIDIEQGLCDKVEKRLTDAGLPHKLICADTKKLKKIDFTDKIDIAFLDGEHTTEAVLHEVELIYPLISKRGYGFIFIHDIVDMGNADAWWKLTQDKRFEFVGTNHNYGLGILRAIEGMESYESLAKRLGVIKL